jgi:cytochrome d ubiquinol oxidase subunit II
METLWFVLVAGSLVAYVVLDGFDLGVGILHLLVARDERERATVVRSVLPVWDGNEVWLIAAVATLAFAFPAAYAAAFSGFYLPLMIVLWLLIGRAFAIELRHHVAGPIWATFWDAILGVTSVLLAASFGLALGNVLRGVGLDERGRFFAPLWGSDDGRVGIVDPYTLAVAAAAVLALALHGALWLAAKVEGPVAERARRWATRLWAAVVLATAGVTWATFTVQPHVPRRLGEAPLGIAFPALAAAGLAGVLVFLRRGAPGRAFLASCLHLAGMVASAAFGAYPYVLPSRDDPARGLTVTSAAAPSESLSGGLLWWLPGMALALAYVVVVYRVTRGKARAE